MIVELRGSDGMAQCKRTRAGRPLRPSGPQAARACASNALLMQWMTQFLNH